MSSRLSSSELVSRIYNHTIAYLVVTLLNVMVCVLAVFAILSLARVFWFLALVPFIVLVYNVIFAYSLFGRKARPVDESFDEGDIV